MAFLAVVAADNDFVVLLSRTIARGGEVHKDIHPSIIFRRVSIPGDSAIRECRLTMFASDCRSQHDKKAVYVWSCGTLKMSKALLTKSSVGC